MALMYETFWDLEYNFYSTVLYMNYDKKCGGNSTIDVYCTGLFALYFIVICCFFK